MKAFEFDRYCGDYRRLHAESISASGESPEYFAEYKIADVADICPDLRSAAAPAVLDFGARTGDSVPYFLRYFPDAQLTCVDVSRKSLELGHARYGSTANFVAFDGVRTPFRTGSFDLVFVACVLHHVPGERQLPILRELHRILRPDGHAVVFEHNPYNPLTVRAVDRCPFDENAELLHGGAMRAHMAAAGFGSIELRYRVFFPRALKWLRPLEAMLEWLPLGAQYRVHARK